MSGVFGVADSRGQVDFHLDLTEGFHSWIHAHGISTLPQARQLMDVNLTGWDGGTIMGDPDTIEPLQGDAVDDMALATRLFCLLNQKYTFSTVICLISSTPCLPRCGRTHCSSELSSSGKLPGWPTFHTITMSFFPLLNLWSEGHTL
jgi:hypothetical protein